MALGSENQEARREPAACFSVLCLKEPAFATRGETFHEVALSRVAALLALQPAV